MSIVKKEAYFISTTGEHKIRSLVWKSDELEPIGVFQIAHGVSEHIERYDEFARFLASKGLIVCGNDHLGHGKSAGDLDDLSILPKDASVRMIDDMHKLHNIIKKRYPTLPYFMFGHSMGSFCARIYTTLFGDDLSGAIFCGTGEFPESIALAEKPIGSLVDIIGKDKKYDFLTESIGKLSNLGIKDKKTLCDWLSVNDKNVQTYIDDPMCGGTMSLGQIRTLYELINKCCSRYWFKMVPQGLPLLLVSGEKDPVGLHGAGVSATYTNLQNAGHTPKIILYPDARHEILNETKEVKDRVYMDILEWVFYVLRECPDRTVVQEQKV